MGTVTTGLTGCEGRLGMLAGLPAAATGIPICTPPGPMMGMPCMLEKPEDEAVTMGLTPTCRGTAAICRGILIGPWPPAGPAGTMMVC